LEEQSTACNHGGTYNDDHICTEVSPTFVPNHSPLNTTFSCIEATMCNCKAAGFVDGASTEYYNSCSEICEVVLEEASHPQQLERVPFRRNTGRAEVSPKYITQTKSTSLTLSLFPASSLSLAFCAPFFV
jgi:hypothetical protein